MAQLKWFIWIAIIVIVYSLHQHSSRPPKTEKEITETAPPQDSLSRDSMVAVNEEATIEKKALDKLLTHFQSRYAGQESGAFSFVYSTSDNDITMDVVFGNMLSKDFKHLIVTANSGKTSSSYLVSPASDPPVILHVHHPNISEHLKDINGDSHPDYFLKDSSGTKVRLYDPQNNTFGEEMTFTEVCFSPAEQLIRGKKQNTAYIYYKMRWNELQLTPVEYLYPHPDNPNWWIKSDSIFNTSQQISGKILWYLPKDYRNLDACIAAGGV